MMKRPLQGGFTLVEVLVYLAIFIMVTTASVYLLISLDEIVDRYRMHTALYRSSSGALEHMVVELRKADQFIAANSVTNTPTTGTLAVASGATSTVFTKSGDELLLSINGVDYGNMVDNMVEVDGFTVYQYSTAFGTLVRVKLDLTATVGSSSKSATVYAGAVIRGDL